MSDHELVWSAGQRAVVLEALDFSLKRLAAIMSSADEAVRARHDKYAELKRRLAALEPGADGSLRVALDREDAAIIKTAVQGHRAAQK